MLLIRKYFGVIEIDEMDTFMDYYAKALWYEEREINNTSVAISRVFSEEE